MCIFFNYSYIMTQRHSKNKSVFKKNTKKNQKEFSHTNDGRTANPVQKPFKWKTMGCFESMSRNFRSRARPALTAAISSRR